ncbi:MAG: bacillithiol biosynthesis cysteine-adding enzyme BshC [Candidatus Acidiferrales bacterium]
MTASMEPHCLSFREIPQTTKLFSSFLEDFSRVAKYYSHPPNIAGIVAAAKEVQIDQQVRAGVVAVLREQNLEFSGSSALDSAIARNLDRLANGAVAIVTGQQVGLFTGPAYSLYKAITAAACADELTRQGVDAVPVFWLATEDHDLAEINHSSWITRTGLAEFTLPGTPAEEGHRVGEIALGTAITSSVVTAMDTLEGPYAAEIARALRESYSPGETYGSAFGKLMARLVAGRGIIFFDPLESRLHHFAAGIYRRALDAAEPLREALLVRSKELERGGFHAQVKVTRESTLLFYNVGGVRHPLRQRNGNFHAGSASFSLQELHERIAASPEAFTPNVLLRPVVQDTLLPTAAYIGGPAEVAYMAQAQVVYTKLLGRMPAILPRASFTVVEPPVARLLKKYSLDFRDVMRGRQHLRRKMEMKSLPRALVARFAADEKALRRLLQAYRKPLVRLDRTLTGALDSAERKMLYQLLKLKGKAGRAENFRSGVLDRHERILIDALYPHRGLQERTLSALPPLAAYGPELLEELAILSVAADPALDSKSLAKSVSKSASKSGRAAGPVAGAADPAADATAPCSHQHHVLFM